MTKTKIAEWWNIPLTNEENALFRKLFAEVYVSIDFENEKAIVENIDEMPMEEVDFSLVKSLYDKNKLVYAAHNQRKFEVKTTQKQIKREKENPLTQEEINELMDCLYEVGKSKAMGDLTIYMMRERCGVNIDEIVRFAEENKLGWDIKGAPELSIHLGTVTLYDKQMIKQIALEELDALKEAGVPVDNVENLVRYLRYHTVNSEKYPNAYRAVGRMFNDPRFSDNESKYAEKTNEVKK